MSIPREVLLSYSKASFWSLPSEVRTHTLALVGRESFTNMARVSKQTIVEAAIAADGPDNEAIFLSCTAFPAVGAISEIEERTGKPVVTSNQASAWEMLRRGGFKDWCPTEYGRLFALQLDGVSEGFAA